ncbi:hypothetical protein PF010_g18565 [Phytophthora fragariae]|uniref:Uncharacterized protein n=1 Tax=Phytophthora fragariae TaxID=53985 RepID=A0A6G0KKE6_9STRA|nr:hypothetical protein PF010_g18565 [Phytophthora fragariae]
MARATAETPRSAAHVLSWLRRCRREELPVERVLDSVRSVAGVVPLGGRVGGSDGATPPRNSALTLFEAGKDADAGEESTTEQLDEKLWDLLLSSCQLPSSGDQQKLRKALETLQDAKEAKRLNIERLRLKFFAARRDFFAVRIELLRAARNPQHPNCQAAEEIVDELLKEGLREALLDEMHGRQFYQPPRFTGVGAAERKALVDWELQFLEEEALLRELLLLTLVASREKATLEIAVKIAKTVHSWEVRLFEDVFTASTLALPVAQESARRLTQMQCRRLFLVYCCWPGLLFWDDSTVKLLDNFVAGLQSGSFADLHRTNTEDVNVLTSFFEFHVDERNDMISAFQVALHETLSTDMSLVMKLLRSSCAVLSSMEGHMGNWNSIAMTDNDEDDNASKGDCDGHFPLVYETEIDCAGVNLVRLESLVTTSLRFLALLVGKGTAFVNAQVARKIMLTPIDDGVPKKRKSLTIVTLCGGYLGYPVEKAPGIAYWSLQILQQAAIVLDYRLERESRDFSSMHSLVALFHGYQDLPLVRGMFSRLLRVSSPRHVALRKEVIEMLTLCLDHQPGFLALLLFGDDRKDDATANNAADAKTEEDPLPFVTLLERFFGASEQLLEQSSDLFCALLTFLVQVWEGAIHNGLGVHLKIMAARNVDC